MKSRIITFLAALLLLTMGINLHAQNKKSSNKTTAAYPTTFTIKKAEFDKLFNYKLNEPIADKSNKYLSQSVPMMNTRNGDMKFLKLKLDYFKNAFLLVQVNGIYSTQVFIMSEDKSVFYKGRFEKENLVMTKCQEDDILSE